MKNLVSIFVLFVFTAVSAQSGFGIKGGLSFNADDGLFKSISSNYETKGENSVGYHVGLYKRFSLGGLFIQPELMYVNYKNSFEDQMSRDFDVKYQRVDVPISVGTNVLQLAYIQAGPVLSYYFEDDISMNDVQNLKQDEIALGFQVGAGVEFNQLSLNLRYDFPLGDRESEWVHESDFNFNTETTPKLLHLSLGYRF